MSENMDKILAEISVGELIDKITILEIKKEKITDKEKLANVQKELKSLSTTMEKYIPNTNDIINYKKDLKEVNTKLWDIENGKRAAEKKKIFDKEFINLSRSVYKLNDRRAGIKLSINNFLGSNIKEVKSHE